MGATHIHTRKFEELRREAECIVQCSACHDMPMHIAETRNLSNFSKIILWSRFPLTFLSSTLTLPSVSPHALTQIHKNT